MLDEDLGPASTQFAFDHFRQQSEEKTTIGETSSFGHGREGNDVDSFEVVIFLDLKLRDIFKKLLLIFRDSTMRKTNQPYPLITTMSHHVMKILKRHFNYHLLIRPRKSILSSQSKNQR